MVIADHSCVCRSQSGLNTRTVGLVEAPCLARPSSLRFLSQPQCAPTCTNGQCVGTECNCLQKYNKYTGQCKTPSASSLHKPPESVIMSAASSSPMLNSASLYRNPYSNNQQPSTQNVTLHTPAPLPTQQNSVGYSIQEQQSVQPNTYPSCLPKFFLDSPRTNQQHFKWLRQNIRAAQDKFHQRQNPQGQYNQVPRPSPGRHMSQTNDQKPPSREYGPGPCFQRPNMQERPSNPGYNDSPRSPKSYRRVQYLDQYNSEVSEQCNNEQNNRRQTNDEQYDKGPYATGYTVNEQGQYVEELYIQRQYNDEPKDCQRPYEQNDQGAELPPSPDDDSGLRYCTAGTMGYCSTPNNCSCNKTQK